MTDTHNKTIKFNLADSEEKKLWEWLQRLPYGKFSAETKKFWTEKMKQEDKHGEN